MGYAAVIFLKFWRSSDTHAKVYRQGLFFWINNFFGLSGFLFHKHFRFTVWKGKIGDCAMFLAATGVNSERSGEITITNSQ